MYKLSFFSTYTPPQLKLTCRTVKLMATTKHRKVWPVLNCKPHSWWFVGRWPALIEAISGERNELNFSFPPSLVKIHSSQRQMTLDWWMAIPFLTMSWLCCMEMFCNERFTQTVFTLLWFGTDWLYTNHILHGYFNGIGLIACVRANVLLRELKIANIIPLLREWLCNVCTYITGVYTTCLYLYYLCWLL